MNKLLTFTGRMPIWQEDLDYMNSIVSDSFKQLLVGLAGDEQPNIVLSGCEVVDGNITAGVVVLDGEILPSRARQGSALHGFYIETTKAGERIFKGGEYHECYEIREAVPAVTQAEASAYPIGQILRLGQLLGDRTIPKTLAGPQATSASSNVSAEVVLRKMGAEYYIRGKFLLTSETTVSTIWTNNQFVPDRDLEVMSLPIETCMPITLASGTTLSVIPGKVVIKKNPVNTSFLTITVEIASTSLSSGTEGHFCTILNTPIE